MSIYILKEAGIIGQGLLYLDILTSLHSTAKLFLVLYTVDISVRPEEA